MSLSSLTDALTNIRRLSTNVAEVVDTINNLLEQLEAVKAVPGHAMLVRRHPEWQARIAVRLQASLTEEIEDLQNHLSALSRIIHCAEDVIERSEPPSVTFPQDIVTLYAHLRNVFEAYQADLSTMVSSSRPVPLTKRSLYKGDHAVEIAIQRLKSDLKQCL